jgi:hypothetical protein
MTRSVPLRVPLTALILVLALAATALAAQPTKGRSYAGQTAHEKDAVILTVSKSGKTLIATVPIAPLYCQGGGGPTKQVTKAVPISSNGSFSGTIHYQSQGKTAYEVLFAGQFTSASMARGTVRSKFLHAPSCSGSTTFTAKPAGAL